MIKWEEFEHIHVVRKLRSILGSWFKVDVLFINDQGKIRNVNTGGTDLSWHNPLLEVALKEQKNWDFLLNKAEDINQHFIKNDDSRHEFDFVGGVKGVAFPIVIDREYFGSVAVFCYIDSKSKKIDAKKVASQFSLDKAQASEATKELKVIEDSERDYFFELSDLVAQEIVTLHKEINSREERIKELNSELGERHNYGSMIGKSKPMQSLYSLLDKIKNTQSTVLVQGENGTGKELIAKAIHYSSNRKDNLFLAVNCAAFNDNLLESELFGHVKGAFTGAVKERRGYFATADKGTLFLDEIGDISQAMQVKLLRVLQDGTYTPVGGTDTRKSNVRIVAATNRKLKQMVEEGTFRQDLYFRLNVIGLTVPPLRERRDDIPLLVEHFLNKAAKERNTEVKTLNKRSLQKLYDFQWPGNIRELENEIERCLVLAGEEKQIDLDMLSPRIVENSEKSKVQGTRLSGKLKDALEELEKSMIRAGLRRCNWNKSRLAKELGISRAGLIMKVDKYGLDKRKIAKTG